MSALSVESPTNEERVFECLKEDREFCFNARGIATQLGMSESDVRKAARCLRLSGRISHCRGLFTEDGEVAGSGWCVKGGGS